MPERMLTLICFCFSVGEAPSNVDLVMSVFTLSPKPVTRSRTQGSWSHSTGRALRPFFTALAAPKLVLLLLNGCNKITMFFPFFIPYFGIAVATVIFFSIWGLCIGCGAST